MSEKLKALFCHDTYYSRDTGGNIYAEGVFPYKLWKNRYLPHFDGLTVLGRDHGIYQGGHNHLSLAGGEHVDHILLDNINQPIKRILKGKKTYEKIYKIVEGVDAVIVRGPAEKGMMAAKAARVQGKPYVVEMSGCAFDQTWSHGSLVGKIYAPLRYLRARHMLRLADQVVYVTQRFLQKRYPTNGYTEYASNVELPPIHENQIKERLKKIDRLFDSERCLEIGMVANW